VNHEYYEEKLESQCTAVDWSKDSRFQVVNTMLHGLKLLDI
jgi:hypothetical protein